jgi:hypothetical protein
LKSAKKKRQFPAQNFIKVLTIYINNINNLNKIHTAYILSIQVIGLASFLVIKKQFPFIFGPKDKHQGARDRSEPRCNERKNQCSHCQLVQKVSTRFCKNCLQTTNHIVPGTTGTTYQSLRCCKNNASGARVNGKVKSNLDAETNGSHR